ncbi:ribonuclease H-like domain-containing protein, partial [Tanacetum coccineum]
IIAFLHQKFSMTDLGLLNYFWGISVTHDSSVMFLSQRKYAAKILKRAHMANCNHSRTPVDTESKLGDDGDPVFDLTFYQSLYRFSLISYFYTLKYFLCSLVDHGLQLFLSSTSLVASSDADCAGCTTTRRSTSEYRGGALVVVETCWLRNLPRELHTPLSFATLLLLEFSMFHHVINVRIFSLKDCLQLCLRNFVPV